MSTSVWDEFDPESFQDYLRAWRDPALLTKLEITAADAAYHVLTNAGPTARRMAVGSALPMPLAEMPSPERVRLVRSACTLMAGFSFHAWYHELFNRECLDLDELAEAHELLMQRDEWDAALWIAGKLVDDQLESDEALLSDLALAHSAAAMFDEELFKHPDVVAGALHILDDEPEIQRIGLWFERAKELERRFNDPTLADVFAAASGAEQAKVGPLICVPTGGENTRSQGAVFLREWARELAQWEARHVTAASEPNGRQGHAQQYSLNKWPVFGEEFVCVRFDVGSSRQEVRELTVTLIAGPRDTECYQRAEIGVDGERLAAEIKGDAASFKLSQDAIERVEWVAIVKDDGERREVDLNPAIPANGNGSAIGAQKPA